MWRIVLLISAFIGLGVLAGCQTNRDLPHIKANQSLSASMLRQIKAKNMDLNSAIMVRIFKQEGVLEVYKQTRDGHYEKIASYDICKWSGKLGPKFVEGDRQAPEGFYFVTPQQMNPYSRYYLSINMGFPNLFDRENGRNGKFLMIHGGCSSAGCYSMSDKNMAEIYAFARDAFRGGQKAFQIQAFPFKMTPANLARYKNDGNYAFWASLKKGYDIFQHTKRPPRVSVCDKQYVFSVAQNNAQSGYLDNVCLGHQQNISYLNGKTPLDPSENLTTTMGTINGKLEANLVAEWTRKRQAGVATSKEPPSFIIKPASAVAKPVN